MADGDSTSLGRTCTGCGLFKPWEDFCKASRGRFGRNSKCRCCMAEYQRSNQDRINQLSLARYHRLQGPKRALKAEMREQAVAALDKRCGGCGKVKPKTEFGVDASRLDGLRPYCRPCKAEESRKYRKRNPDTAVRASAAWAERNPERVAQRRRKFQSRHDYRVMHAISARIYLLLKGQKNERTERLVGYSAEQLVAHIERQFLPGMTWGNYGDWHVDHIRPLSSFAGADKETVRSAWCLSNLRPIWAEDNLRKNSKMTHLL